MVQINIDMPSSCLMCPLTRSYSTEDYANYNPLLQQRKWSGVPRWNFFCALTNDFIYNDITANKVTTRHPNCPLINI